MSTWQELVADKKQRQQAAIPKDWLIRQPPSDLLDVTGIPASSGLLTAFELEVTETVDVGILLAKLATSEWSSVNVTRAYYKRAIIAHQVTNCLTEIFVERALSRAAECDAYLKTNGKPMGALHGLPISLKDQFSMKDLETTIGFVYGIGNLAKSDATLVKILYEAGAVPFVRTNVPQTLMWTETFNNVFGRTVNPFNRNLTSGGSSGGEGALVGMKGSPIGVGTDIAGSIRVPSAFNGLYSLRPSSHRLPFEGLVGTLEGWDSVPGVLGPMSNSLSGVKAFTKAVIDLKPWNRDPAVIRKDWDEDAYRLKDHGRGKDLCFAIMWDNGCTLPHPPIRRAMEETKQALMASGFKVIDWPSFNYGELCTSLLKMWAGGVSEDFAAWAAKSGEPLLKTLAPEGVSVGFEWLPPGEKMSVYESWQLQKTKSGLRKEHLDLWESTASLTGTGRPVDAIITPVAAYASVPHGRNIDTNYTMIWNALDYTTSTFPVSTVDPAVDVKQTRDRFLNDVDEFVYNLYDPSVWRNAPIALQLVGRSLEEEAVIGMTEIVAAALKKT
ncbi:general amidase [Phellopilus nigrolimitatus]|nr:general amidase [Phellopilus nigrolimitatus]